MTRIKVAGEEAMADKLEEKVQPNKKRTGNEDPVLLEKALIRR